ncbi:MAG: hypothetical protein ACPIOQ_66545, partial [Promethearchaeia archaeon]
MLLALPFLPQCPTLRLSAITCRLSNDENGAELVFANSPATSSEMEMVARVDALLSKVSEAKSSNWLAHTTHIDILRYVRAVAGGRGISTPSAEDDIADEFVAEVEGRLLKTAAWREERGVDAIAADDQWSLDRFFALRKTAQEGSGPESVQEAIWLDGVDAQGRPVACFFADRHTPGEIDMDSWRNLVLHSGEYAIREQGVADGPGGQFTLLVDRSRSGIGNQDPQLALALLPELLDHY